jgi:glycine/D-amino acid oxidase-like deaminating enzyme
VVQAGPVEPPGPARVVHAPDVYLRPHAGGLVHLEAPDAAVDLHTSGGGPAALGGRAAAPRRAARSAAWPAPPSPVTGVCVRPMPADGQSIVGWLPGADGLYVAVTHSGVTLAAHLARLITAELVSGTPAATSRRTGRAASPLAHRNGQDASSATDRFTGRDAPAFGSASWRRCR